MLYFFFLKLRNNTSAKDLKDQLEKVLTKIRNLGKEYEKNKNEL